MFSVGNVRSHNNQPANIISGLFSIFPDSDTIFKVFMEMENVTDKNSINGYARNVIIESDTSEFLKYQPLGNVEIVKKLLALDIEISCVLST